MGEQQVLDLPTVSFIQAEHLADAVKSQCSIQHLASRDGYLDNLQA